MCGDISASIDSSKFYVEIKEADSLSVHKKKSKLSKENYKPISILRNISKVYEGCLYDHMSSYFEDIFFKTSMRFSKRLQCTTLAFNYDRKIEKKL